MQIGLAMIIVMKTMLKSYIISVLDYCISTVDVFKVSVPTLENDEDVTEFLEGEIEKRGHNLTYCHWMSSDSNQFKCNIDL